MTPNLKKNGLDFACNGAFWISRREKKKKAHSWAPGQQLALVQRAQELVRARGLLDMGGHIHFPLPPSSNRMFNHHHHFQLWLLASSVLGVAISCTKSICRKWWFTSPLLKKKKVGTAWQAPDYSVHQLHHPPLCTSTSRGGHCTLPPHNCLARNKCHFYDLTLKACQLGEILHACRLFYMAKRDRISCKVGTF